MTFFISSGTSTNKLPGIFPSCFSVSKPLCLDFPHLIFLTSGVEFLTIWTSCPSWKIWSLRSAVTLSEGSWYHRSRLMCARLLAPSKWDARLRKQNRYALWKYPPPLLYFGISLLFPGFWSGYAKRRKSPISKFGNFRWESFFLPRSFFDASLTFLCIYIKAFCRCFVMPKISSVCLSRLSQLIVDWVKDQVDWVVRRQSKEHSNWCFMCKWFRPRVFPSTLNQWKQFVPLILWHP